MIERLPSIMVPRLVVTKLVPRLTQPIIVFLGKIAICLEHYHDNSVHCYINFHTHVRMFSGVSYWILAGYFSICWYVSTILGKDEASGPG